MAHNITQTGSLFEQKNLDLIIAATRENFCYFTSISPVIKTLNPYHGQAYALLHRDNPERVSLVQPLGEVDQVLDADAPIGFIETYGVFYREYAGGTELTQDEGLLKKYSVDSPANISAIKALIKLITKYQNLTKLIQIGYDEDGFPPKIIQELRQIFPLLIWTNIAAEIRVLRQIKTAAEIKILTHSARINETAIHQTISKVELGNNEVEIANCFNQLLASQGASPSLTMIKIGRAAVGGQRRQDSTITLKAGDLLWFDSDSCYNGYWADIARVYAIETVAATILKRYQALRNGMLAAFFFIRPGLTGKQVFHHVMETVHRSGFSDYRRHHVGHAIGLEPYELPILGPFDENIIEEGMVLSLETPYYEFGIGALHIEDPLVVGANGNRFLTANPVPEFKIL